MDRHGDGGGKHIPQPAQVRNGRMARRVAKVHWKATLLEPFDEPLIGLAFKVSGPNRVDHAPTLEAISLLQVRNHARTKEHDGTSCCIGKVLRVNAVEPVTVGKLKRLVLHDSSPLTRRKKNPNCVPGSLRKSFVAGRPQNLG